jgi:integrase
MPHVPTVAAFCAWQAGRNFSPRTIARRRGTLNAFARHVAPADLFAADRELVEEFLAGHRAPRTRHAYLSDLSVLYRWASRRVMTSTIPAEAVDSVRLPRTVPRPVDPRLIPGIIAAATDDTLALMVALAACAGLRRAEIAALGPGDIGADVLVVRNGKGGKDRVVPIHPLLAPLLCDGVRRHLLPFGVNSDTVGRRIAGHLEACGVDATAHLAPVTPTCPICRCSTGGRRGGG